MDSARQRYYTTGSSVSCLTHLMAPILERTAKSCNCPVARYEAFFKNIQLCTRICSADFRLWKKLSMEALLRHDLLRLIDGLISAAARASQYGSQAY